MTRKIIIAAFELLYAINATAFKEIYGDFLAA